MNKGLFRPFLLVVLILILFIWIVKSEIVSWYLTRQIRVPVSITRISTWPSQTTIYDFKAKNPSGFKTKTAIYANRIEVDYKFANLFGDSKKFEKIEADGIFLNIEFENPLGTKNNWSVIARNMPKTKSTTDIEIKELIFNDITISIQGLGLSMKPKTFKIGSLKFNDINSETGFPTEQIIRRIFEGSGVDQYIRESFDPQNTFDRLFSPL